MTPVASTNENGFQIYKIILIFCLKAEFVKDIAQSLTFFSFSDCFKMISYVLTHLLCLVCVCSARPHTGEWRLITRGWACPLFISFCPFAHPKNSCSHTHTHRGTQTLPTFLQHESVCGAWLLLRQPLLRGVILKKCIPASKIKAEFKLSCNTKSSKFYPRQMQWLVFLFYSTFTNSEDRKELSCDWLSGEQGGAAVPLLHDPTHAITHHPRSWVGIPSHHPRSWGWAEDQVD